ncbi:MAG: glycosyltransferase family protein [Bdellovibrionota bacterium]
MKTIITIEARMGSSRLPGKMLLPICEKPILQLVIERLKRVKLANEVVVATTVNLLDDEIEALCKSIDCAYFRGSEPDVLDRLIQTAKAFDAEVIAQTTGDCPLIDPAVVDEAIKIFRESNVDYVSNRLDRTYPTGVDPQVFYTSALERVAEKTNDPDDREHGSYYIYTHPHEFTMKNFKAEDVNLPHYRWLLDYPEDFEFTKAIYERLYPSNPDFTMYDVLKLLEDEPELIKINSMYPVDLTVYKHFEVLP